MTSSPSPSWTLRSGTAADAEAVVRLWKDADAEPGLTDDPASVRALVAHQAGALVVAEADGRIIGSLIAAFDGWRANLYRLAVHPDLRRRGVARDLVAEAERRLREQGARRVNALVVADHDHAVRFWEAVAYGRDLRIGRHVKNLGDAAGS